MTGRPLLTRPEFDALWATVNATYPPYKQSGEELSSAAKLWFTVLGVFTAATLHDALTEYAGRSGKRPTPFDVRECAQLILRARGAAARAGPAADNRACACGCGGIRWLEVMRDDTGAVRRHPEGLVPPIHAVGHLAARMAALVGQPMLRPRAECKRQRCDLPTGDLIGTEEGQPVYLT